MKKKPEDMTREELLALLQKTGEMRREYMRLEQQKKIRNFREMNQYAQKGQILFTGSSLMEQFPVTEYSMSRQIGKIVYNRGIGGTTTDDFLREIDTVLFDLEPSRVFINIGTNDMAERADGTPWQEHLLRNYESILCQIKERLPETKVFVMAYYPANLTISGIPEMSKIAFQTRTPEALHDTNEKVKALAEKYGFTFVDVNDGLKDENGLLREELTTDGVHMFAGAYISVFEALLAWM